MARSKKSARKGAQPKGPAAEIGIIGGSGLYSMTGLTNTHEVRVKTPFGDPSDAIVLGTLEGKRVAFLARHGRGHLLLPGELNYRANIYAMKVLVADQFFDSTKGRKSPFFGNGIVAHVTFDKPTCAQLSTVLADACASSAVPVHRKGTYICMEGPQFSTLAEANFHRAMKFDVVGMTNVTEAKLAREAEICYSGIAMITDYDCWHPDHESVTGAQIMETLSRNAENAQRVLREAVRTMPAERTCKCGSALRHALITDLKLVPPATKKKLAAIIGKYIS